MRLDQHCDSKTIKTIDALHALHGDWCNCTIQNLDLTQIDWTKAQIDQTTFLGCNFGNLQNELMVREKGAVIHPHLHNLPYNPYRHKLYSWQELMDGYDPYDDQSVDWKIYKHFDKDRHNPNINEALAQRIHDYSIDEGLRELLQYDDHGMTSQKIVGFMGGHGVSRASDTFYQSALTAKLLTEAGFYVASGGGPGIMEAANFGAYMAGKSQADFEKAMGLLKVAPKDVDKKTGEKDPNYIAQARKILAAFPEGAASLAIPTWFYGHEPSNLFASQIAKYFSNAIREDTLLAIALHGIVFAPGSAGTTQEIFMDATQNHYGTFGYYSPMVFLGKKRYRQETMLYTTLAQLAREQAYADFLHLTDEPQDVVNFIAKHPPIKV